MNEYKQILLIYEWICLLLHQMIRNIMINHTIIWFENIIWTKIHSSGQNYPVLSDTDTSHIRYNSRKPNQTRFTICETKLVVGDKII